MIARARRGAALGALAWALSLAPMPPPPWTPTGTSSQPAAPTPAVRLGPAAEAWLEAQHP